MEQSQHIKKTEDFVRERLQNEGSGHGWFHVDNVRKLAIGIASEEEADLFIVELAALLHDIADWKFNDGDTDAGPRVAREHLESVGVDPKTTDHVCRIVERISFKGAGVLDDMDSIEGRCVQDADRLEAMGAVGIARCFAYGGSKHRAIYDPTIRSAPHDSFDVYKSGVGTSVNHFYEKLLLLKDRMNTNTGRRLAEHRHTFMERFLEEFFDEWNGKK
jgi:uncharacterized protein